MEKWSFRRLLKRYTEDRVSKKEKTAIEAWLDTDKTAKDTRFSWTEEDENMLFRKVTAGIDKSGSSKSGSGIDRWLKVAATVLLLSGSYTMSHWLKGAVTVDQTMADGSTERE